MYAETDRHRILPETSQWVNGFSVRTGSAFAIPVFGVVPIRYNAFDIQKQMW